MAHVLRPVPTENAAPAPAAGGAADQYPAGAPAAGAGRGAGGGGGRRGGRGGWEGGGWGGGGFLGGGGGGGIPIFSPLRPAGPPGGLFLSPPSSPCPNWRRGRPPSWERDS